MHPCLLDISLHSVHELASVAHVFKFTGLGIGKFNEHFSGHTTNANFMHTDVGPECTGDGVKVEGIHAAQLRFQTQA